MAKEIARKGFLFRTLYTGYNDHLLKGKTMEELFIELANMLKQAVIDNLEEQELPVTPQNIIAELEETIVMAKAEFGEGSLAGTMIPCMMQWFIDQEKLNLLVAT